MKKGIRNCQCVTVRCSLFFLFLFGAAVSNIHAEELKIGFTPDIPPFIIGEKGLEVDIVRSALQYKGHTFKMKRYPYKRLQIAVSKMGLDGAAAVRKTEGDGVFYSDDFIAFQNVAITKKKSGIVLEKISDLKGKSILAWQNAHRDLGKEFEDMFSPATNSPHRKKYDEIPIQRNQNMMFWKERADVIVIDETIFLWYRNQLSEQVNTTEEVIFHNIFDNETHFQVAFKDQRIRDDFNEGLRHLRESGIYQQLLDKYIE